MGDNVRLAIIAVTIVVAAGLTAVVFNQSGEIGSLSQNVSNLEVEKTDLAAKLIQLEKDLTDTKAEVSNLAQTLSGRETEISSLKGDVAAANSEISRLKSEVAGYLERIRILTIPIDQRHLNASRLTQKDCLSCHPNTIKLAHADGPNRYHNIHLNNRLLNFTCTNCHKQVDISAAQKDLSKLVDTDLCVKCHKPFPAKDAMNVVYKADLWLLAYPDCTNSRCHSDWKSSMKEATFINLSAITVQDCFTCHGKNVLFDVKPKNISIPCSACH